MVFYSDRNGFSTNDMFTAIYKDVNMHLSITNKFIKTMNVAKLGALEHCLLKTSNDLEYLIYSIPMSDPIQTELNQMLLSMKLRHQFVTGRAEFVSDASVQFADSFEYTEAGPSVDGILLGM